MTTRSIFQLFLHVGVVAALTITSCNKKDVYDEEEHKKWTEILSPIDSVDQTHTWKLATVYQLSVTANTQTGAKSVLILSANPSMGNADILARAFISDGQTVNLSFSAPTLSTQFVAAVLDAAGQYTLADFVAGQESVTVQGTPVNVYTKMQPQTYTYCYNAEFPYPDNDYDYNDLVLRISLERSAKKEVDIGVTLAAVGTNKQIAAAIRLDNYLITDIDSIVVVDGQGFSNDIPGQSYEIIDSKNTLVSGRNNEAVLNLFEDAHWSMGDRLSISYGLFLRKYYNVSSSTEGDYQLLSPRTVKYRVYFKDDSRLNNFSFDSIDPFIIEDYNGSFWEVHVNKHKFAQTMYEYTTSDIKNLPWAFEIPDANFRYPYQGVNIGFIKEGVTFGAYMTDGYSFGEWAEDHTKCTDWYLYPTKNMVY